MEPYEPPRLLKRRVATAPTLLQPHPRTHRPGEKSDGDVDTLFKHSNAKVVSLVALSDQTFSLESSNRDTIGPWQSHFERTIAIGSLRLYRAPGSVAFLSCGSALQPIFPKSQCWCMEEDGSKFILQIRPPGYWRIELASPSPPGNENTLRDCLESVLLLDKTPCPFKESVPILLPSESPPPKNRRPWKPLRSYPSEPILARGLGGVGSSDSLLLRGDGPKRGTLAEVQDNGSSEKALGDNISRAKFGPKKMARDTPRGNIRDETRPGRPEVIDEPSLQIARMQNSPSPASTSYATPSIDQGSTQSAQDFLAVPGANQTADILLQPNEEGRAKEKPRLIVNERGKIQRRYTIASSGNNTELDVSVQKANTSGVHSREPGRQDKTPNTFAAHSQQMFSQIPMDVATPVKSHCYRPATSPQNAARRRAQYKELSDSTSSEDGRRVRHPRETAASPDTPGPGQAGSLPESIFLLFYTISALIMLVAKVVEAAIVNLWKLTENTERIHHQADHVPGQTFENPDTKRTGDDDI